MLLLGLGLIPLDCHPEHVLHELHGIFLSHFSFSLGPESVFLSTVKHDVKTHLRHSAHDILFRDVNTQQGMGEPCVVLTSPLALRSPRSSSLVALRVTERRLVLLSLASAGMLNASQRCTRRKGSARTGRQRQRMVEKKENILKGLLIFQEAPLVCTSVALKTRRLGCIFGFSWKGKD